MFRITMVIAASVALTSLAVQAQTPNNTYFSIAAGVNKMEHEHLHVHLDGSSQPSVAGDLVTKPGPAVVFSLGRSLGTNWRVELEGDYRSDKIKGETGLSGENNATGTENKYGVMANAIYDFGSSSIHPYFGIGLGGQFVHEPSSQATTGTVTVSSQGATKGSFAYQGIAGLSFPIQGTRNLTLTLEYRYLALTGSRAYKGTATIPGAGSFPLTDTSEDDNNHTVLVGIRIPFGS